MSGLDGSLDKTEGSIDGSKSQLDRKQKQQLRHQYYEEMRKTKSLMNFESKLEKDLQETQGALISQLKKHSVLSSQNITLMKPIEKLLTDCFETMKKTQIDESKNYFAMSLKMFF